MIVFLTHRRLKTGRYAEFREAWEPEGMKDEEVVPDSPARIVHARAVADPDEVVSFGIAGFGPADMEAMRAEMGGEEAERRRQERMARFVESTGVDAPFEVIEQVDLNGGARDHAGILFLTHRRLRPGTFDRFRHAWLSKADARRMEESGLRETAYHARSLKDPDEIVSFGLAELGRDELESFRGELADSEAGRQRRMAEFVEWTGVDAVFEVVEHIRPRQRTPA